jgi:hypothetical protein
MIRETSRQAYETIAANDLLSERRWEVYDVLFRHGAMTANEVFVVLEKESAGAVCAASNSAARFSELRELGVVQELGTRVCSVTGMNVIVWGVTENLPKQLTKKERIQKQINTLNEKLIKLNKQLEEVESK